MARKNEYELYDQGIQSVNIADYCTDIMLVFGANNNLMRHLSELFDGLKIGERRILYTMYKDLRMNHKSPFIKVASIVGSVLSYHPHGEAAVGDTLVKMAQSWNNMQCLIEGSGNFGSPAGDPAGASRYIEARLSYYAYKCFFEEFDEMIVDVKENYLKTKNEPLFLPAKYPNVLINNVFGIGYGINASICTYNLKEVLEATIKLIQQPDIGHITLIPDSSTGAYIIDEGQFDEISKTGKGKFKMRGVIEIDEEENALHIRSTPYQAYWVNIKKDVFNILTENKTNVMKDFKDFSTIDKIHYVIYLKKEIDPVSVMHKIYARTQMEKTIPVSFTLVEDFKDIESNIRDILQTWIDFRKETKRRFFNHKLVNVKSRQHILEILLFILNEDNAETTVSLIKGSSNKKEIVEKLMKRYGISSLQASTIAEMKLLAFSKEAYKSYIEEKKEIDKLAKKYEKILKSRKKIDEIIIEELEEGIKLFGEERRSKIITVDNEVKIRDTLHKVVFTHNNYIKKLPDDIDKVGIVANGDYPTDVINCKNTDDLLVFDASGKISKIPVSSVQGSALASVGEKLSSLSNINRRVVAVKIKPDDSLFESIPNKHTHPYYFVMVTKNGIIKKTPAVSYMNIKSDLLGMIIKDNDELVAVKLICGDADVLIYTKTGMGIRFNTSEVRETSRQSIGVKAIEMDDNDSVIGMDILSKKDKYIFMLTRKGNTKKSTLDNFKTMQRASKPLNLITLADNDEIATIKTVKGKEKFSIYLKNSIDEIDIDKDVVELPRRSRGVKRIPVKKGDFIIDAIMRNDII